MYIPLSQHSAPPIQPAHGTPVYPLNRKFNHFGRYRFSSFSLMQLTCRPALTSMRHSFRDCLPSGDSFKIHWCRSLSEGTVWLIYRPFLFRWDRGGRHPFCTNSAAESARLSASMETKSTKSWTWSTFPRSKNSRHICLEIFIHHSAPLSRHPGSRQRPVKVHFQESVPRKVSRYHQTCIPFQFRNRS